MAERRDEIADDRAMDHAREVPRSRPSGKRVRPVRRVAITVAVAAVVTLAGAAPATAAPDPGEP